MLNNDNDYLFLVKATAAFASKLLMLRLCGHQ